MIWCIKNQTNYVLECVSQTSVKYSHKIIYHKYNSTKLSKRLYGIILNALKYSIKINYDVRNRITIIS